MTSAATLLLLRLLLTCARLQRLLLLCLESLHAAYMMSPVPPQEFENTTLEEHQLRVEPHAGQLGSFSAKRDSQESRPFMLFTRYYFLLGPLTLEHVPCTQGCVRNHVEVC